jgi:hypothetical protein
MFDTILAGFTAALNAIPFTAATWSVIGVLGIFVWLFSKASRDPKNPIRWEHLIIDSTNDRASPYKMGFLIGGLIGTWIVVKLTDANKLTFDIFGLYLSYLLGGASVNTFFKAKGGETTPGASQELPTPDAAPADMSPGMITPPGAEQELPK